MSTSLGWASTVQNGGLFDVSEGDISVRVRLPGGAARVINNMRTGGFIHSPSALGLSGFRPTWLPWQYRGTRGRMGKSVQVGDFKLGRTFLKSHVVREPLGVLPADRPADHSEVSGPISFVEMSYKPVHMRVGFHPSRAKGAGVAQVSCPLTSVNWVVGNEPAQKGLEKAMRVNVDPGLRRGPEAPAGARLRARARWVLQMNPDKQNRHLGMLLTGRWTPDLSREFARPCDAMFVAARAAQVKFLGGGTLIKSVGEGEDIRETTNYYVNATRDGVVFKCYPELIARLASYATLRKRVPTLVTALRTRALEWCKKQGFSAEETAETIGPSVALAYFPTSQEKVATEILGEAEPNGALPKVSGWWSSDL